MPLNSLRKSNVARFVLGVILIVNLTLFMVSYTTKFGNTKSIVDLFLIIGNFFRYTKTHNYYFKIIPAGKLVPSLKIHYQIHLRIMDQYGISCHIFFYRD